MRRIMAIVIPFTVLLLMVSVIFMKPVWLEILRLRAFDVLHERYPRAYDASLPVKIIDIDEESLKKFGQWPWPRNLMAQIVQRLTEGGVGAIGLDIVYAEPDRLSPAFFLAQWKQNTPQWKALMQQAVDYDQLLAEALSEARSVTGFVMSSESQDAPLLRKDFILIGHDPSPVMAMYQGAVVSLPQLSEAASGNGALNSLPDRDGIIRRIPLIFSLKGQLYPSLVTELLRVAQGNISPMVKTVGAGGAQGESDVGMDPNILSVRVGQFTIPTNKGGDFYVHYTRYSPERYVPAWQLLSPDFDVSSLQRYIVLIGTSAAGLKDIRATPINPLSSGVEIHAQALEQVISGGFLSRPDWIEGAEILGLLGLGIVLIVCMHFLSALWGALFCGVILFSSLVGAAYAFNHFHLMLDAATPAMALLLLYMFESLRRYIITERERREIRHAFVHYMSPALVEKLAANPDALKLGGETRDMTILFC
ncbi:MAG: CHASE2 domain-containing protein, partial [Rickettsiales bacterium]|nr:CHASE2 domain-containing protein [Rickettsiales bacterium]